MGGALIVGQGTTPDEAKADYMQQAKEAQKMNLYPDTKEPEIVASKGQYLAVGHVHS